MNFKEMSNFSDIFPKISNDIFVFYRASRPCIWWSGGQRLAFENNIETIHYTYKYDYFIEVSEDRITYGPKVLYYEEEEEHRSYYNNARRVMFDYYHLKNFSGIELNEVAEILAPYIKKELIRINPDVGPNNIIVKIEQNKIHFYIKWVKIETKVHIV
mgnify:FL=1